MYAHLGESRRSNLTSGNISRERKELITWKLSDDFLIFEGLININDNDNIILYNYDINIVETFTSQNASSENNNFISFIEWKTTILILCAYILNRMNISHFFMQKHIFSFQGTNECEEDASIVV